MMTRLIYCSKWDPIWEEVLIRVRAGWLAGWMTFQWSSSLAGKCFFIFVIAAETWTRTEQQSGQQKQGMWLFCGRKKVKFESEAVKWKAPASPIISFSFSFSPSILGRFSELVYLTMTTNSSKNDIICASVMCWILLLPLILVFFNFFSHCHICIFRFSFFILLCKWIVFSWIEKESGNAGI